MIGVMQLEGKEEQLKTKKTKGLAQAREPHALKGKDCHQNLTKRRLTVQAVG